MSIDLTKFWLGLDNNFMPTYTRRVVILDIT